MFFANDLETADGIYLGNTIRLGIADRKQKAHGRLLTENY